MKKESIYSFIYSHDKRLILKLSKDKKTETQKRKIFELRIKLHVISRLNSCRKMNANAF